MKFWVVVLTLGAVSALSPPMPPARRHCPSADASPSRPPRKRDNAILRLKPWNQSVTVEPVPYEYSDRVLVDAGKTMAAFVQSQRVRDRDNRFSTPLLEHDVEWMSFPVGREKLRLDSILFRTSTAVIMTVSSMAKRVIKYQSNCQAMGHIHPLVRDFALLRAVQPAQVTPKAFFLSPPALFVAMPVTGKTAFSMTLDKRVACAQLPGAHVRYMLMERAGLSVDDWVLSEADAGRRLEVSQVMRFTADLVIAVQKIHERGVIHGDIHWGNVVLMDRAGVATPGLIDFGVGSFVDELVGTTAMRFRPMALAHCFMSHWNMQGFRFSFRDDVFKAILVGAFMLNGLAFQRHCQGLEEDATAMLRFKSHAMWFTVPELPNRIAELPVDEAVKQLVTDSLTRVLALIRSVHEIDAAPPYKEIYTELISSADQLDASISNPLSSVEH